MRFGALVHTRTRTCAHTHTHPHTHTQIRAGLTNTHPRQLFRDHIFQLGVTFHGGANLIGYPWGDFTHCEQHKRRSGCVAGWVAPDKLQMHSLGERLVHKAEFGHTSVGILT